MVQLLHYCPLIGRELHSDATPALLCHKEPAQGTQSPLLGAFLPFAGSLWHKDKWLHARKGPIRGGFNAWKGSIRGGVGIGGVGIGRDGVGGDGVWVLCYKVICGRGCRSFCIFICKIEMNENRKTFYLTL